MIKNLLLIVLRNFKKDKWFSLVNILGLTIGITLLTPTVYIASIALLL